MAQSVVNTDTGDFFFHNGLYCRRSGHVCFGGQSSSQSVRGANKYFCRSSLIHSKSCRECDGLTLFSLRYPAAHTRRHVCSSRRQTCIYPPLPRRSLCRGDGCRMKGKKEEARRLADCLTFPSCPPCLQAWRGCRVEPAIKILLSQPTPMAQWGENKQAHW